jgi:hypothetical protein
MTRRALFKLLFFSAMSFVPAGLLRGPRRRFSFYVAGARFGRLPAGIRPGDRLSLRKEPFGNEVRFALYTEEGLLLGQVPRDLARKLARTRPFEARLISVDPDSVPWKAYEVEISFC